MGTAAVIPGQEMVGESQRLFSEMKQARYEELMSSGMVRPFTVINFNWFYLRLAGELQRYSVPSASDERLPKDVQRVSLEWDGRERVGHAVTFREPHLYGRMVNASAQNGEISRAIPERAVAEYLPIAIAYSFLEHYSPIFVTGKDKKATAPPKDARRTFGVLVFEGDLHTISAQMEILRGPEPDKAIIQVPIARVTSVGRVNRRIFETVPFKLKDYLGEMFRGQLNFAKVTIGRAQQKWSETQTVKDISESDRIWYRWAIAHHYADAPKSGEKHWLNELISVENMHDMAGTGEPLRKCQACRVVEPEANTPFCPKCGAPIDTFATFTAGFPVADAWLMALKGEQRTKALAELKRRKKGFGEERGSYKGKGKGRAAAQDETADATDENDGDGDDGTIPGEETE
jgi:hypothetical protein